MFTGLVLERGRLSESTAEVSGSKLRIAHSLELGLRLSLGASLSVAGVCLTVIESEATLSVVELSPETRSRTTLGHLRAGEEVNLEPALRLGDPLGGHWVQGHVDTTVAILERHELGEQCEMSFALPDRLANMVVEKGSVALDGVSLTVAHLKSGSFSVALIPHTLARTTLGNARVGQSVNFEADILAKYVERALQVRGSLA
jgi:riboflavin synthase